MNIDRIPAISVWQPWASLIAAGLKPFEVRGWCPPKKFMHRPIAIHAAMKAEKKKVIRGLLDVYQNTAAMPVIEAALRDGLPRGAVLCTVAINSVMPSDAAVDPLTCKRLPAGGFAWQLDIVHYFSHPIHARGMQGFWWWKYNPATRRAEQGALWRPGLIKDQRSLRKEERNMFSAAPEILQRGSKGRTIRAGNPLQGDL